MEAISAVASTTQLLAYCLSAGSVLCQVIKDIKAGTSAFRHQENNINHILKIIRQISRHPGVTPDMTDIVLPIIIEVAELAQRIQTLLENPGTWYRRVIASSTRRSTLEESFNALAAKGQLLHLHISHSSNCMLFTINHKLEDSKVNQMSPSKFKDLAHHVITLFRNKAHDEAIIEIGTSEGLISSNRPIKIKASFNEARNKAEIWGGPRSMRRWGRRRAREDQSAEQPVDSSSEITSPTQSDREHQQRRYKTLPPPPASLEIDGIAISGTRRYERQWGAQVNEPWGLELYQYDETEEAKSVKGKSPAYTH